ncbi:4'-phosphopantetheinyl transferase family protein [Niallia sp. Krafla_26]|uniref:4'-phosphopantetheinyl transferase family protein n=1 Tax=Niallia sp. Krafla_26 TaxID=3064703 RepID=UPI003D175948
MEIYGINQIQNVHQEQFNHMLELISEKEKQKVYKYHHYQDAVRYLIGRLMIRYCIKDKLEIPNGEISIERNHYGKPFITSHRQFHFNVSHTDEWVVCATDYQEIGIDIEKVKPININSIMNSFSEIEKRDLNRITVSEEKLDYFYDLWTLKESYVKALGQGLFHPIDSFSIRKINGKIIGIGIMEDYYFKQIDIAEDYKLSVCSKSDQLIRNVKMLSTKHIYQFLRGTKTLV